MANHSFVGTMRKNPFNDIDSHAKFVLMNTFPDRQRPNGSTFHKWPTRGAKHRTYIHPRESMTGNPTRKYRERPSQIIPVIQCTMVIWLLRDTPKMPANLLTCDSIKIGRDVHRNKEVVIIAHLFTP